ncbi:MAG: flagellar biosynthesis protein FlhB [Burkholderiales bacterium]|nr:flagellar biosynthesis protein FlhB [Burkholderiales bacterium]
MADSAQDRKLPATQRKIDKARREGQVARSRDLGHFGAVAAVVALVGALAPQITQWLVLGLGRGLRFDHTLIGDPAAMGHRLADLALQMLAVLVPLFGVMVAVALAGSLLCGGWNFTLEAIAPKFGKLDPLAGLPRLFSGQQLVQTLKACVLAVLLGGVGGLYLAQHWWRHAELLALPLPQALAAGGSLLQGGMLLLCGVLAAFALVDVPLQRHMLQRRLRMSIEEVKKEMKEAEGSTQVKAKIRLRMREMANRRMLAAVPGADLVVMNPTHYAVALKYDAEAMAAPRVIAKGADLVALKIRDLARDARVPVLQSPALARALYAHTEIDQEIPARLFSAVAQVLAWVYQLRDAMAAGRPLAADAPMPEVPADLDPLQARPEPAAEPAP